MAEEPKYTILHRQAGYEIREYDPAVIAEVVVEGPYRYAMNWGFNLLADYIFGNNRKRDSIPMTKPVTASERIPMTAPVMAFESIPMTAPMVASESIPMTAPVLLSTHSPVVLSPSLRSRVNSAMKDLASLSPWCARLSLADLVN